MNTRIPGFCLVFFLSACQTPYQADAWYKDGGFSERRVSHSKWIVTFTGNENTSLERARDFSYLRAAELCQSDGYDFVTIHHSRDVIDEFEEETSEVEVDEDGNEEEVGTSFHIVRSPRTISEIECKPANAKKRRDTFGVDFLAHSIASKYDL